MQDKVHTPGEDCLLGFSPSGKKIKVPLGTRILDAALKAGVTIDATCGGKGTCGKCRVIIEGPTSPVTPEEERFLRPDAIARGERLACRTEALGDCLVRVPSVLHGQAALAKGAGTINRIAGSGGDALNVGDRTVRKIAVEVPEPSLTDETAHWERLMRALDKGGVKPGAQGAVECRDSVPLALLRGLPGVLRKASETARSANPGPTVTVVMRGGRPWGVEPGDTTGRLYGVAFDIGTTTVMGALLDLARGEVLGVKACTNSQVAYGADVISRLNYCVTEPEGLTRLHESIIGTVNGIIGDLACEAGIAREDIYEISLVGNTTMYHLFLGLYPGSLSVSPYVGVRQESVFCSATELGIEINPAGMVYFAPNIAGFVGSDTVAMILACGMHKASGLRLALDLGTNAEMVLGDERRLLACSTAAGPAFEGALLKYGMRAAEGAIYKVDMGPESFSYETVGGKAPVGICGSGVIDLVAGLLRNGIVDKLGRLLGPDELTASGRGFWAERVREAPGGLEFVIAPEGESGRDEAITFTQRDIRQVQLAKAAVSSGAQILMRRFGAELEDIEEVIIAGAFGNNIRAESAMAIGLLPQVPLEKVRPVGNAAGDGARLMLLSLNARQKAQAIGQNTEHIELATDPEFQNIFMERIGFD